MALSLPVVVAFAVGLFVGSFLNVLVLRLRAGEGFVAGRSRCPHCRRLIAWYDNIPLLSFLLLRGKCRQCGRPIALLYPLVEGLTGLTFGVTAVVSSGAGGVVEWIDTAWLCLLSALFIAIAVYDVLTLEIEMRLYAVALAATLGYVIWRAVMIPIGAWWEVLGIVAAGSVASLFLGGIVWYSRERWMGWGDVWLVFPLALLVGPAGLLPFLTLAFGSGALIGLGLISLRKKTLKSPLPLGPFLVWGALGYRLLVPLLSSWNEGFALFLSPF